MNRRKPLLSRSARCSIYDFNSVSHCRVANTGWQATQRHKTAACNVVSFCPHAPEACKRLRVHRVHFVWETSPSPSSSFRRKKCCACCDYNHEHFRLFSVTRVPGRRGGSRLQIFWENFNPQGSINKINVWKKAGWQIEVVLIPEIKGKDLQSLLTASSSLFISVYSRI